MMLIRFSRALGAWALLPVFALAFQTAVPARAANPKAVPTPHRLQGKAAAQPPIPSGEKLLAQIRAVFRSHRPPPPFTTYTLTRAQQTEQGYPDYADTYTYHIWCRSSDRAALKRKVFRDDYRGPMEFDRPAFNEARDPGPPTADIFEPAPLHPHPVEFVPTPEPASTPLREIGAVKAVGETQYRVTNVALEGTQYHVSVVPLRDPDRNRLREIYVDAKSLEIQKFVATDKLFIDGGPTYAAIFTTTMGMIDGRPVVRAIHGQIESSYVGNGEQVDYEFKDIAFPQSLPGWYFDPHTYASHSGDAPS
ncbi:MAG: hypothetical protein NVS9B12_00230 [Vulcanimicrobiaceae bacterium]